MIRILFYLVLVFLLALGFSWLAERPGDVVMTFAGYRYEVSLMVAAVSIVILVGVILILWWLLRSIWNSPYAVARYFRVRRRDRGYQALSTGMIAAGAGDGGLARRMGRQAGKLLDSDREPLIHLLDAQAALLEGDRQAAREKFEAMLDDPEMRLLGLHGLYLEAQRVGDRAAARHYAERAADTAPQLGWAADATLEARTAEGDWDGALKLVDAQKASRQVDREAATRRRVVLLTAKAHALADTDPAGAQAAALEANRLQPDFVPAAIAAAKALFRHDDLRRGAKILEAAWKKEPHPEIADVYVHARTGDSVADRLHRARKLQGMRPHNAVSELTVARAALDAGEYTQARKAAEAALRMDPRESGYLLLADIEEAESGDQGRVRQWLSRALRAPRDPAWVADGYVAERWAPVSPVTGRFDAFEWRVPMERLGQVVDADADIAEAAALAAPSPHKEQDDNIIEAEVTPEPAASPKPAPAPKPAIAEPEKPAAVEPERPAAPALVANPETAEAGEIEEERYQPPRPPDDPGVEDEEDEPQQQRRFKLF
jgi:HemY protein